MANFEDEFFDRKRPWSRIKDSVLDGYLPPYLRKIVRRRTPAGQPAPIVLIDAFAGPGIFADGSRGSPLIILANAEIHAPRAYEAIFINRNADHHRQLQEQISQRTWTGRVRPLPGAAEAVLPAIATHLGAASLLLYLDPFGMRGVGFEVLRPFLERTDRFSTEIVFTMSMPVLHRLAAANAVRAGEMSEAIASYHQTLTTALHGDWWQPIMFSGLTATQKAWRVAEGYQRELRAHMPYVGMCPVHEEREDAIKYFMFFASRHPDAMLLMHDQMAKSYHKHVFASAFQGTMFENQDYREQRAALGLRGDLDEIIVEVVRARPGLRREDYWLPIVQAHFMLFQESEYKAAVKRLVQTRRLAARYTSTGRMNDDTLLSAP